MARADVEYSQLSTLAWGQEGRIIAYQYDDNGSLTSKTTTDTATSDVAETVVYTYNLQHRLATVTTTPYSGGVAQSPTITEYRYNPQGIRVAKVVDDAIYTDYLIDPYNPTGYAQVLEETTDDGTTLLRIQYTIGDDVISQTQSTWDDVAGVWTATLPPLTWTGSTWTANPTQYLLYDGHGSTRQLVSPTQTVQDSYSYDAYGVMLGSAANPADTADTNYLYAGEQYDPALQMYYNRARYYNPSNGLFNRVDPYSGNLHDPQSLHKYAYCHNNPVNNIDPTGMWSLSSTIVTMGVLTSITSIYNMAVVGFTAHSVGKNGLDWSGIIINLFAGGSGGGFGGNFTLSIYFDFATCCSCQAFVGQSEKREVDNNGSLKIEYMTGIVGQKVSNRQRPVESLGMNS